MPEKTPEPLAASAARYIAYLDLDPLQPNNSLYKQLHIKNEDREKFAVKLYHFLHSQRLLIKSNTPQASRQLADLFLVKRVCLQFWPKHLVVTKHKWFHKLSVFPDLCWDA
jgi:hypothetical protein